MCYLIEYDENVMKEASKKLKSLKTFIKESQPRESGIPLWHPRQRLHQWIPNYEIVKIESN